MSGAIVQLYTRLLYTNSHTNAHINTNTANKKNTRACRVINTYNTHHTTAIHKPRCCWRWSTTILALVTLCVWPRKNTFVNLYRTSRQTRPHPPPPAFPPRSIPIPGGGRLRTRYEFTNINSSVSSFATARNPICQKSWKNHHHPLSATPTEMAGLASR